MLYQLSPHGAVLRQPEQAHIPPDPANTDYQQYLTWLAAGHSPAPADPPPAPDTTALRRAAYAAEADPLFFMAARGEATQAQWLDKVAEIKARYP